MTFHRATGSRRLQATIRLGLFKISRARERECGGNVVITRHGSCYVGSHEAAEQGSETPILFRISSVLATTSTSASRFRLSFLYNYQFTKNFLTVMTMTTLDPPPAYEGAASQHGTPAPPLRPQGKPRGPFPLDIPVLNQLRGKRIILASASPRRKQLLAQV
jgi:hypothetical protein